MKYLILATLLLAACSNTTGPSVCEEYKQVPILKMSKEYGGELILTAFDSMKECDAYVGSLDKPNNAICEYIISNTGCN